MKVPFKVLRPTQICIGNYEVSQKKHQMEPVMKHPRRLKDRLRMKKIPVVVGKMENGQELYFLIDGHHKVCALKDLGVDEFYINIVKDYSKLNEDEFWEKMKKHEWVYLVDDDGKERNISDIPTDFSKLKDDPYRSLAGFCRDKAYFYKTDIPYAEFAWGEFLRQHKVITHDDWRHDPHILKEAKKLCKSDKAQHLPGWKGDLHY
jgi:hypothetical protein